MRRLWLLSFICAAEPLLAQVETLDLTDLDLKETEIPLEELSEVKTSNEVKIEDIVEPENDYRYSSFGGQDPFQVPIVSDTDLKPEDEKPQTAIQKVFGSEIPMVSPLQAFPLQQLSVKGVWKLPDGEARAIVMTPDKQGVVVKKGDPIAVGKILDIQRKKMLVRQYRLREDGTREFSDIEVKIGNDKPKELGTIKLNPGETPQFDRPGEVGQTPDGDTLGAEPLTNPGSVPAAETQGPGGAVPAVPNQPASAKPVTFSTDVVPDTIVRDGPAEHREAVAIPPQATGLAKTLGVPIDEK